MKFKYANKILSLTIFGLTIFGINNNIVNAATAPDSFEYKYYGGEDDQICFNKETGAYKKHTSNWCGGGKTGPWGVDRVKYFGTDKNNLVYCAEWNKDIDEDYNEYIKESTWDAKGSHAFILGNAVNIIQKDNTDSMKEYANAGAMINHYFKNTLKYSYSYKFEKPATFITTAISEATTIYNETIKGKITTTSMPNIKVTADSKEMEYVNKKDYISGKLTISNLQTTYGNSEDTVTYTITASSSAGSIVLCTTKTKCSTSNTISIKDKTIYSFYVKLTGNVNSDTDVNINIVGKNSSTYYTAYLYKNAKKTNYQRLLYPTTITINRKETASIPLTVPDLVNYTVRAYKVNELGEPVDATLKLTRNGTEQTFTKSGNRFTWSKQVEDNEANEDEFYNAKFCVTEVSTEDGFILDTSVREDRCITPNELSKSKTCYKITEEGEENETVDMEFCNWSSYDYKCAYNGNVQDIPETGDCNSILKYEKQCLSTDNQAAPSDESCSLEPETYSYKCVNSTDSTDIKDVPESGTCDSIITYEKKCAKLNNGNYEINGDEYEQYCGNENKYMLIEKSGTGIIFHVVNKKNSITVSKKNATTTNKEDASELTGTSLKICTTSDYKSKGEECTAATTTNKVINSTTNEEEPETMEWTSTATAKTWTGLKKGEYTIIELTPPQGYIKESNQVVNFSIDEFGVVKLTDETGTLEDSEKDENGNITKYVITLKNNLNKLTISKQDITTSKELPGAKLTICESYTDPKDNKIKVVKSQYTDECIPITLVNGSEAKWTSTDEPHQIEGIPAGTYFLVEQIAPKGYSIAESIQFTVTTDGKILDANNKDVSNNKIIMKDKIIEQVETGDLPLIAITLIGLVSLAIGIGCYQCSAKNTI